MRKEYSLIKDNIILEMYNTDDIDKIKIQPECDNSCRIVEKEEWHVKGLNILRYQNGVLLSNKEAIERGIIVLKENEVLIGDCIITLDENKKVVNDKIVYKTMEEQYIDGVIGDQEYDKYILDKRLELYNEKIDSPFIELMQEYVKTLQDIPLELKEKFDILMREKQEIKKEYLKTTNIDFNKLLERKMQNLQESQNENIR